MLGLVLWSQSVEGLSLLYFHIPIVTIFYVESFRILNTNSYNKVAGNKPHIILFLTHHPFTYEYT